jgi:molecular chaperone GrpE (heat shock protein)
MGDELKPAMGDQILERLDHLTDLFRRRLLDDKVKAQTISELTAQLDGLRLTPLCREFIMLLERIEANGIDDQDDLMQSVSDEILAILHHYGLERIVSTATFDPTIQRIVGTQSENGSNTMDESECEDVYARNTVVKIMKHGYTLNGVVIRPEDVIVARRAGTIQP